MVQVSKRSAVALVGLVSGALMIGAGPAHATCVSTPWSNPTVVCAEVEKDPVTVRGSVSVGLIHHSFEVTVPGT